MYDDIINKEFVIIRNYIGVGFIEKRDEFVKV